MTYGLRRSGRGDSPLVALLHGAASNRTRWSELLDATALAGRCDFLRPDLRGNGESMCRGRMDLGVWAGDMRGLLDAQQRQRAILVGHSLGAQIAMRFAAEHPERTSALVLIDPVFRAGIQGNRRRLMKMRPLFQGLVLLGRMLNGIGLGRRTFPNRDLRELDRVTRDELKRTDDPQALVKKYTSISIQVTYMPRLNYVQQLLGATEPLPPLEKIACPVLVLAAAGGEFGDTSVAESETARFKDGELLPVDADHWPLTEAPDATREMIENWLLRRELVPAV
ncbi:hypothetical protein ABI59_10625 [Acidobacteria bacterium Mor1]|nr:hypothetical protein ABI59_10625 [Acidobacteria bacterium Mor1]